MALKDRRHELIAYISSNRKYLATNIELFDIYNGNLKDRVLAILEHTLNAVYFDAIKERVIPINILERLMDKLSGSYLFNPIRRTDDIDQDILNNYEKLFGMNSAMDLAEEYTNLFRGYALEPFVTKNEPKLRVLPFDRFLVKNDGTNEDEHQVDVFIKMMGQKYVTVGGKTILKDIIYTYTDDEFDAFDIDGNTYAPALAKNDGKNPFGTIPFFYGSRSKDRILPTQETDLLPLTTVVPVILTDTAGALMHQCFSIIYAIDAKIGDEAISPNAIWDIESDQASDKNPQIGTISPKVDSAKVMSFLTQVIATWLESKGVKVGNIGSASGDSQLNGISKLIDNADTVALMKKSMGFFKKDEYDFWHKMKVIHNTWVKQRLVKDKLISSDFDVSVKFDEPQPVVDRETEVKTKKLEVDSGFLDNRTAIEELYPDLTPDQVDERIERIEANKTITIQQEGNENG